MWAIRILNGPQTGQVIPLKTGTNRLGRATVCEVKINSNGVSKEHASILVTEDKLFLTDKDSRNGTFVNGVRIQNQRINVGDKLGLHDVLIDIVQVPDQVALSNAAPAWAGSAARRLQEQQQFHQDFYREQQAFQNRNASAQAGLEDQLDEPGVNLGGHSGSAGENHSVPQMNAGSIGDLFKNFKIYIDNVAMPGVYRLVQAMPYRYSLAAMVFTFVMAVTLLSTIPMVSVTKAGIRQESVRRAKTIARNLAANNRQAVIEKNDLGISVKNAELEEGVTDALIISAKDGTIMAPASKRGEYANKPFVNQARREERETDGFITDSQLGVSVPITSFNPEIGNQSVIAYAIILYDMGAQAMNSTQTLSLMIENLLIALLAGFVLFFFLYKVVEQPIIAINGMLDDALREGRDDVSTPYRHSSLEALASNINSALSRIRNGGGDMPLSAVVNRDIEATNLVLMLNSAAITVNAIDERIIAVNEHFNQLIGGGMSLQGRPLSEIPDPALQQNLRELIPRMREQNAEIALSEIPFPSGKFEICGHAIMGSSEPSYFLVTLTAQG